MIDGPRKSEPVAHLIANVGGGSIELLIESSETFSNDANFAFHLFVADVEVSGHLVNGTSETNPDV